VRTATASPVAARKELTVIGTRRRALVIAAVALSATILPAAAANAAAVPIAGTIIEGSVGDCSPPTVDGSLVRWRCTGATETYSGDLTSTADAVFDMRGTFNAESGATTTSGSEIFTRCIADACGTLEWNRHVTFRTVPGTLVVLSGRGQARITAGTGAPADAKGSFTIACEPNAPCAYKGHVVP
jgi:hypothetical protein